MRWRNHDQPPVTATSRAYRALVQLHALAAAQEAEAIERVRRRLASHVTTRVVQTTHSGDQLFSTQTLIETTASWLPGSSAQEHWRHGKIALGG
jgi:hypothetical protein